MEQPIELDISCFKATEDPHSCLEFLEAHHDVLKQFGIEMVTSNGNWASNDNAHVITVRLCETGKLISGARVEIATETSPLPIEGAIKSMDSKIIPFVAEHRLKGGIGELCGLWSLPQYKLFGLGMRMGRAAVSIVERLEFKFLTCIVGIPTLRATKKIGFVETTFLGENGTFPYPKKDMTAWVLGLINAQTMETATPEEKRNMMELRTNPTQTREENSGKIKLKINYNLKPMH